MISCGCSSGAHACFHGMMNTVWPDYPKEVPRSLKNREKETSPKRKEISRKKRPNYCKFWIHRSCGTIEWRPIFFLGQKHCFTKAHYTIGNRSSEKKGHVVLHKQHLGRPAQWNEDHNWLLLDLKPVPFNLYYHPGPSLLPPESRTRQNNHSQFPTTVSLRSTRATHEGMIRRSIAESDQAKQPWDSTGATSFTQSKVESVFLPHHFGTFFSISARLRKPEVVKLDGPVRGLCHCPVVFFKAKKLWSGWPATKIAVRLSMHIASPACRSRRTRATTAMSRCLLPARNFWAHPMEMATPSFCSCWLSWRFMAPVSSIENVGITWLDLGIVFALEATRPIQ